LERSVPDCAGSKVARKAGNEPARLLQELLEERPRFRRAIGFIAAVFVMEQHDDFKERPYFVAVRAKLGEAIRENHDLIWFHQLRCLNGRGALRKPGPQPPLLPPFGFTRLPVSRTDHHRNALIDLRVQLGLGGSTNMNAGIELGQQFEEPRRQRLQESPPNPRRPTSVHQQRADKMNSPLVPR
jgi:hypothetical protein